MSANASDDLEIEKIEELDTELESADQERDTRVKAERGRLYEISLLPKEAKIVGLLGCFLLLAVIFVLLSVLTAGQSVFLTCCVLLLEAGIAVLLERAEFFVHGVVFLLQIAAGALIHALWFMVLGAFLYLCAVTLIRWCEDIAGNVK